jgi:hypothetical protein
MSRKGEVIFMSGINFDAVGALNKWDTKSVVNEPDGKITAADVKEIIRDQNKREDFLNDVISEYHDAKNKGEAAKANALAKLAISILSIEEGAMKKEKLPRKEDFFKFLKTLPDIRKWQMEIEPYKKLPYKELL